MSIWRWSTGPEQFIWNHRGLTFSYTRKADNTPSANNGTWTRGSSTDGPSVNKLKLFDDGMPLEILMVQDLVENLIT